MSYCYDYYIGYIDKKDGLVYPYGPFIKKSADCFKLMPALTNSRSYNNDLDDYFTELPHNMYSDALKAERDIYSFLTSDYQKNPMYCRVSELPDDSFVKSGYFPIREVAEYQVKKDPEVFCDRLDPLIYNGLAESEMKFGRRQSVDDDDELPYSASDYMFFSYPDTNCLEYYSFILKQFIKSLSGFEYSNDMDLDFVIIETEG